MKTNAPLTPMLPPSDTLADSIVRQREALKTLLRDPLAQAAQACSQVWSDRQRLNAALAQAWAQFPSANICMP